MSNIRHLKSLKNGDFPRIITLLQGSMDVELKKRLIKCYVWRILLYGLQTWTLERGDTDRVEYFKTWSWMKTD